MKKKLVLIIGSIFIVIGLSGCASGPQLTDEESQVIAQYAANLIVDYHSDTKSRMLVTPKEEIVEEEAEESEEVEEDVVQEEGQVLEEEQEEGQVPEEEHVEDVVTAASDINEILPVEGTHVSYLAYEVQPQYYANDGMGITAKKGNTLIILKYQIENVTDGDTTIDFFGNSISASLLVNNEQKVPKLITILPGDLATIETTIAAGESEEAFLLFEIPEDSALDIASLQLTMMVSGNKAIVDLL